MIRNIYIAWRKSSGERRNLIARIKRNANGISFKYLDDFKKAQEQGLDYFFGFKESKNLNPSEVKDLLTLRVISKDRPDRAEFLKFWEADDVDDIFDLLGYTQGISPTDNFEFLADFTTVNKRHLKFVTDIAGLSKSEVKPGMIKAGDVLRYVKEPNNAFDDKAVAVYKDDLKIGYIKRIHTLLFYKCKSKLNLTVKSVVENGIVKNIYVKVEKQNC